jgi:hypothetical protein
LFQKRLKLVSGLIDTTGVDEMVLVCRRGVRSHERSSVRVPVEQETGTHELRNQL